MTNSARLIRGGLSRAEIDALNAEAWQVRRRTPARAAELSRLTKARAEQTSYHRGAGQALVVEGFLATRIERADVALECCLAALSDLEPDGPTSWLAWAHTIIGAVSSEVGEIERARQHYAIAYQTAVLAQDPEAAAGAQLNAALLHEDPADQLPLLHEAVASFEQAGLPSGIGFARYNLAECLLDLGRVEESHALAEQTLRETEGAGLDTVRLATSVVLARCLAAQGHPDDAVRVVREHLAAETDAEAATVAEAATHLAALQAESGDIEGALLTLVEVEAALPAQSAHAVDLARSISEYHARTGDFDAAYQALRRHQEQRTGVATERTRRRVAILEVLYKTRETEAAAGIQRALADELDGRVARLTQLTEAAQQLSLRDDVTGLANRRRLDRDLATLGASTSGRPVCLAYIDLDELGVVNAELGHLVGDTALRQIARVLERSVPEDAVLARLEAEDFALLLEGVHLTDAVAECERLRSIVESHSLSAELHGRGFTVSIGVAEAVAPFDAERLMRLADDALYEAKDAGRNRVVGRAIDGVSYLASAGVASAASDRDDRSTT